MSEWQDIATAPKDGTAFLAWHPSEEGEDGFFEVHFWVDGLPDITRDWLCIGGVEATAWMPLPQPPVQS